MKNFFLGIGVVVAMIALAGASTRTAPFQSISVGGGALTIDDDGVLTATVPIADASISNTLTIGSSSVMSSPPAIGGVAPATGTFTTLTSTGGAGFRASANSNAGAVGAGTTQWSASNMGASFYADGARNPVIGGEDNAGNNQWAQGSTTTGVLAFYGMPALGSTSANTVLGTWNLSTKGLTANGTITSVDDIKPLSDLGADLGTGSFRYSSGYIQTLNSTTVNTSALNISGLKSYGAATPYTISSGAITVTHSYAVVAAESGTSDILTDIAGGSEGAEILIRSDSGDTITLDHNMGTGTANVLLEGSFGVSIDDNDIALLVHNGNEWIARRIMDVD